MRLRRSGSRSSRKRLAKRLAFVLAVLSVYAAYWVFTPSMIDVPHLQVSSSDPRVLIVTLHNPTFKFLGGELITIDTEQDVPNPRGGGNMTLASVPREYTFVMLPGLSQQLDIPMNSRVLPGVLYDITVNIDGVGRQTITVALPSK